MATLASTRTPRAAATKANELLKKKDDEADKDSDAEEDIDAYISESDESVCFEEFAKSQGKSQDQKDAEVVLCQNLGIQPAELDDMRSGLGYISKAIKIGTDTTDSFYMILSKAMPGITLSHEDFQSVYACITDVGSRLQLPEVKAANVFAEVHRQIGGYFTQCSTHLSFMYNVALFAKAAEKMDECRKTCSDQKRSMLAVLHHIGLHGDAMLNITETHATETVEESMQLEANRVVDNFNKMPEHERIYVIFKSVSEFGKGVAYRTKVNSGASKITCFNLHDDKRPNHRAKTAAADGATHVGVHLLLDSDHVKDPAFVKEFATDENTKFRKSLCGLYDVFYAHDTVYNPNRGKIMQSMCDMFAFNKPDVPDTNIRRFLRMLRDAKGLEALDDDHMYPLHELLPIGSAIAVKYNTGKSSGKSSGTKAYYPGTDLKNGEIKLKDLNVISKGEAYSTFYGISSVFSEVIPGLNNAQHAMWFCGNRFAYAGGSVDFYISIPSESGGFNVDYAHVTTLRGTKLYMKSYMKEYKNHLKNHLKKNKELTPDQQLLVDNQLDKFRGHHPAFGKDYLPKLVPIQAAATKVKPSLEFKKAGKRNAEASEANQSILAAMPGKRDYAMAAKRFKEDTKA